MNPTLFDSLKVAAFVVPLSALLTRGMIWLATRRQWLSHPREDRWSTRTVTKFGGVAILSSFLLAAAIFPVSKIGSELCLLTAAMGALGFIDDVFSLKPRIKFLGQLIITALAVYGGVIYVFRSNMAWNVLFTMLWIVSITNAFNLLDNMDGLASGVGIITALSILFVQGPDGSLAKLTIIMAASLLGYLFFNFYPAKTFMGDTGSLALGFFLACSSVVRAQHLRTMASILFVPALVLFLPIFDLLLVSITRRLNGRAISAGAKDHTSHRLVMLGMSERKAVFTLYAISALAGLVALFSKTAWPEVGAGAIALFLVIGALFWLYMANIKLPEDSFSRTSVFTFAIPEFLNALSKNAAVVFLDLGLIVLSQYLALLLRFGSIPGQLWLSLLLTCALAVMIKLPLMAVFSVYRRNWHVSSLKDIYPIVKAGLLGSALLITILTFLTRFADVSRAVWFMDMFITIGLLISVRVSHRVFDDALVAPPSTKCVLVGGTSAQFFARYFEWSKSEGSLLAIVVPELNGFRFVLGVPIVPCVRLEQLLQSEQVDKLYILPDCLPDVLSRVKELGSIYGIPIHIFRFKVENAGADDREMNSMEVSIGKL